MKPADLLQRLVALPSPSGEERAAADAVQAWLTEAGVPVRRLGDTLLARRGRGGPRLMFLSHLDTVPVGEGWTRDPFASGWQEGRLYGRGANDAKGPATAMLCAFLAAPEPAAGEGELLLALTAREETDNAGMAVLLEAEGPPDAAVCGEPTGLRVVRAQGGLAVLRAVWTGRSCHAAHAARVEHHNALLTASRELAGLPRCKVFPDHHPLLGHSTLVPTVLRAGERRNVVPAEAEAWFDLRRVPGRSTASAVSWLQRRLPRARVEIVSERLGPVETPEDHPLVQAALEATGEARAVGSTTLSDLALLAGVPAVKCGPGRTERSHVPDEYLELGELQAGVAVYRRLAASVLPRLRSLPSVQP